MKKLITAICCVLLIAITFTAAAFAADEQVDRQYDALELEQVEQSLPQDAQGILGDTDIKSVSLDEGLGQILQTGGNEAKGALKQSLRSAGILLIIVLLCGLVQTMYDNGSDKISGFVPVVGAIALTAAAAADITSFIAVGKEMMDAVNIFSKGLLAALAGISGTMGKPASAAAKYMGAILFSDVLVTIIDKLLMPILYAYVAVVTANAAIGEDVLGKLGSFLKWVCVTVLGLLLTVFTAYISVSGIVSGSADVVTAKTAKLIISNAVPVVGKILSDATETVLAGAGIIRSSLGVFGLLGVIAICVGPFVRLGIQYIVFKVAGVAASPLAEKRLSKLIDDLAGAYGILLGMVGASAVIMMISVVSLMSLMSG